MKFIDKMQIYVKSGDGGKGCSSFRRERCIPKGGPDGGHGGKGGDIIFVCNKNLNSLNHLKYKQKFIAENGHNGQGRQRAGKNGQDIIIRLPLGTQLYLADSKILLYDFKHENDIFIAAKGGRGGAGNSAFKSSTNRAPKFCSSGQEGEELSITLELKLNSDVTIIGMPNVGKSTLLANLTFVKTKIAPYPFSTTHPIIGSVFYEHAEYTIADIPGLIENAASDGISKKFLKHLEKTKILVHLIDACSISTENDFDITFKEIQKHSKDLAKKPYIVALSKCDMQNSYNIQKQKKILENKLKKTIFTISNKKTSSMHELIINAIKLIN